MRYFLYLFWFVVLLLGISFASLNPDIVSVHYYFHNASVHLPILLFGTLLMGSLLGMIAMLPALVRNKRIHFELKHRIKEAEQEVNNLRSIPIKDTH